jgi:predicted Zn-ribbon and HTH transcriptional regulator
MIREILPECGGQAQEIIITTYRMWHCFDCGLRFSMLTRERPALCPRCKTGFEVPKDETA